MHNINTIDTLTLLNWRVGVFFTCNDKKDLNKISYKIHIFQKIYDLKNRFLSDFCDI